MDELFLPLTPEILVPRLGEYLIEKQLITTTDLVQALSLQKAMRQELQNPPLIGQLLVSQHKLSREDLDQAITELIIDLRQALERSNLTLEKRVKERTAQLADSLVRLAEANKEKTNFVANVSHELRTPLTHLMGYLELLATDDFGTLSHGQHDAVQVMQRSTVRLQQLIDDLILFSTSQKEQPLLMRRGFSIDHLTGLLFAQFQRKAVEKYIHLARECEQDIPAVHADEGKISWVISHLLDNALKFTPPGGSVWLAAQKSNGEAIVSVRDTGIGIPVSRINEIFEPFHQLDGSSTRSYGGTGLGLALVKQILETHGAELGVSSTPGQGSSFTFNIPYSMVQDPEGGNYESS